MVPGVYDNCQREAYCVIVVVFVARSFLLSHSLVGTRFLLFMLLLLFWERFSTFFVHFDRITYPKDPKLKRPCTLAGIPFVIVVVVVALCCC